MLRCGNLMAAALAVNVWRGLASAGGVARMHAIEQPNARGPHQDEQHRAGDQAADMRPIGNAISVRLEASTNCRITQRPISQ